MPGRRPGRRVTLLILAAVTGAAILHAGWNAVLRGGSDRLWSMTLMMLAVVAKMTPLAHRLQVLLAAIFRRVIQVGHGEDHTPFRPLRGFAVAFFAASRPRYSRAPIQ